MEWGTAAGPREADEADGEAGCGVEEEPEAGFVLGLFVVRFIMTFLDVSLDGRDKHEPGEEVANKDGKEG